MCDQVFVLDLRFDGSLDTIAELRAFGFEVLPEDFDDDYPEDACLCGVDVEATFSAANRSHIACDGSQRCRAGTHVHGCFQDRWIGGETCDNPRAHGVRPAPTEET